MNKLPIFFSDLDRTLIYSKKFSREDIESIVVEEKNGKAISYMTIKAYQILQKLKKEESTFIPVSTRTWETINRIDFINELIPDWMVCDNGAHIYHKGERLREWEEYIKDKKDNHTIQASELEQYIYLVFKDKGLKQIFNRENTYLMIKFEEMTGEIRQMLEALNLSFRKKGYRLDINSRKAYLLPDYVRKEDAVQFLIKLNRWKFTIGAGDSHMDLPMLWLMNYPIAPKHKSFLDNHMYVTLNKGIKAGEEILHYVQHICRYCNNEYL